MITPSTKDEKLSYSVLPTFKSNLTDGKEVRVLGTYDRPLFIAKDIAEMLGYKNTKKAIIDHIDEEDKLTCKEAIKSKGNDSLPFKIHPDTQLMNESGLYSLILRSKLPSAKEFKRWVENEILPTIKKYKNEKIYHFNEEFKDFQLTLPDGKNFMVSVRNDGYINATQLCQAGNKRINNYTRSKQTEAYLQALRSRYAN